MNHLENCIARTVYSVFMRVYMFYLQTRFLVRNKVSVQIINGVDETICKKMYSE